MIKSRILKAAMPLVAACVSGGGLPTHAATPAKPVRWQAFADCAAAYRANAQTADPDRSASMKSMISETASDYQKAAEARYQTVAKVTADRAHERVDIYVGRRTRVFAAKSRQQTEHFIDACPQTDG